jgi:hypothetical protein
MMDVTDIMCQVRQNTKLNTKPTQNGSDIIMMAPTKYEMAVILFFMAPTKYEMALWQWNLIRNSQMTISTALLAATEVVVALLPSCMYKHYYLRSYCASKHPNTMDHALPTDGGTGVEPPSTVHICNAGVSADISPISAVVPLAGTMTASLVDPAGARDLQ